MSSVVTSPTLGGKDEFAEKIRKWNGSLSFAGSDLDRESRGPKPSRPEKTFTEVWCKEEDNSRDMAGNSKSESSSSTEEDKAEMAVKAKLKFLENLHKFQRKASEPRSSFQRSYRGSTDRSSEYLRNARRSHRPTASRKARDSNSLLARSSLRKQRTSDSVFREDDPLRGEVDEGRTKIKSIPRSSEDQSTSRSLSTTRQRSNPVEDTKHEMKSHSQTMSSSNKATPAPGSARSASNIADSPAPPRAQRRRSRAELAAAKHKDRIRKASASSKDGRTSLSPPPIPSPKPRRIYRNHERSANEPSRSSKPEITKKSDHIDDEWLGCLDTAGEWFSASHMDDSPLAAVIDMLTNGSNSTAMHRGRRSSSTHRVPAVDGIDDGNDFYAVVFSDEERDVYDSDENDVFETINIRESVSGGRSQIETKHKEHLRASAGNEDTADSTTSVVASPNKSQQQHFNLQEGLLQQHGTSRDSGLVDKNPTVTNEPLKITNLSTNSRDQVEDITQLRFAASSKKTETINTDPICSENLATSSHTTNATINYNAEEAIETFRRLSQEIDQIKSTSFRRNVTENRLKSDPTISRPKFSLSHPDNTLYEQPITPSEFLQKEPDKFSGKQPDNRHLNKDLYLNGSIASFTRETKEEKRNKKEKRKERNETLSENKTQTNENNHLTSDGALTDINIAQDQHIKPPSKTSLLNISCERKRSEEELEFDYSTCKTVGSPGPELGTKEYPLIERKSDAKMTSVSVNTPVKRGSSMRFRKMSSAQRKERLREVVLRHRSEPTASDSDSSLLSEASSDASDIDMNWLDDAGADESVFLNSNEKKTAKKSSPKRAKPKKHQPLSNGSNSNGHANEDRSCSPQDDVGSIASRWETKAATTNKAARSSPVVELDGVRSKLDEAKAIWAAPTTTKSAPTRQRRRMSFEKDKVESGDDRREEPVKVGSMLSMWESKKEKQRSAQNATEDEAFNSNTVGRLKGAKALFESMSKQNNSKPPLSQTRKEGRSSSPRPLSTPIKDVKNLFETKNRKQDVVESSLLKRSRKEPASSPRTPITTSATKSNSKQKESLNDSFSSQSTSSSVDLPVADRLRRRNDELVSDDIDSSKSSSSYSEKEQTTVSSRTRRRRNKAKDVSSAINNEDRKAKGAEKPDAKKDRDAYASTERHSPRIHNESGNKQTTEMLLPAKDSSPTKSHGNAPGASKSNIQSKISARRKRSRRPMTQPITIDDVTSAKQRMMNEETSSDQSSKETDASNQEEEKTLSFSERLEYFNQIIARSKVVEPEEDCNKRRHRGSVKRYLTQPIDREAVAQAKELHRKSEAARLSVSQSDESVVEKQSVSSDQTEPVTVKENNWTEELTSVDGVKQSVSEPEVQEKPRKVGKLSSELKTKFLESQISNNLPSETAILRSPRQIRRNKLSESPIASPPSVRRHNLLSENLSTPLPGLRDSLHLEEDTNSEDSDMGKNRETEIKATGSIHDRLKLLEQNKEEGWKKRLKEEKKSVKSSLGDRLSKLHDSEEKWKKGKPSTPSSTRGTVDKANISDRLNSIMSNSENWKSRKGRQNDATQFTVQAKIAKRDGVKVAPVPTHTVKRKTQPVTVNDDAVVTVDDVTSDAPSLNKLSEVLKLSQKGLEPEVIKTTESSTTEIPDMVNEDFENFFSTNKLLPTDQDTSTNGDAPSDTEDATGTPAWLDDDVSTHSKVNVQLSDIGRLKTRVQRPSSRKKRSSRNPVKALAARTDIKQSYTEHRSNISKLEQQRIASRHGYGANFTSAAIAGLAAKADLSKVNLRNTKKTSAFSASDHKPWKDKMLLRVKGRRHVQTRLVEPVADSLNSGDAFLLILPDKLFAWFGDFSNVIEKAKVTEIADYIIHKGDLGSKATSLHVIKEEQSSTIRAKEFWSHLGGRGDVEPSGGGEEDEMFEINAEATIKSYKLEDSKLIPHKASWGKLPTMAQLSSSLTYVFDFGAEMYIWHGKEVSFDDRQLAIKLARALWDQGYDYTDLGFCPFLPFSKSTLKVKGSRPDWGLFARITENLETALVQEKFEDWSNIAREVGDREDVLKETSRGHVVSDMKIKTNIAPDLTSCDVNKMKENKSVPQPLLLEGYNVWKGHGIMYDEDGRGLLIVTNSVNVWQATDKALISLEDDQKGTFHRSETYVVSWRYVVSSTGKWKAETSSGDLKGDPKGRERVAYFLWPGCESTINDKGASALMATEIDKDIGSQVAVTEWKEPPAFSQCFNGGMIVVDGKRGSREGFYSWKLFCVRGSSKEEAILHQVPCNVSSLRSRTSFIAVYGRQGKVVVWHGAKSPKPTRDVAAHAAEQIQKEKRACLGFRHTCRHVSVEVCEEENENSDFTEAIGRLRRSKYLSLVGFKNDKTPFPRLWHLCPTKDEFVAQELHPVLETRDEEDTVIHCFPHAQQQLKEITKPAFVILENSEGVYLWQSSCDEELTGSSKRQFDISRRLAMETAVDYCKNFRSSFSPLLVHELHEPVEFTNSFPVWKEPGMKISFEEKRAKKPQPLEEILKTICRLTYGLEELRASPLPEGVDPNHLETYLTSRDFDKLFQMEKEEFYSLPPWKQNNLRKEKNLF